MPLIQSFVIYLSLCYIFCSECASSLKPILPNTGPSVRIPNGLIHGFSQTYEDKPLSIFLGIPYAEPPLKELRFKKPVPIKPWSTPVDAREWPNPCFQLHPLPEGFLNANFSEDCLYLNIWTPVVTNVVKRKAVMVWIHGGALNAGATTEYYHRGHVLAAMGDVVFVSIGYRVNTFGFLYTGTDDAPGNQGLWDQALGLKWINENIEYFGGDPKRVTIFGISGGAWAVSLHMLSPVSRHLFKNVILMSGAANNGMAGDEPSIVLGNWYKGANIIGCGDKNSSGNGVQFTPNMIECMIKAPAATIATIPYLVPKPGFAVPIWMSQVVIDGEFLPQRPQEMLITGNFKRNFNLIIGSVEDEGSPLLLLTGSKRYQRLAPTNVTYPEAYAELREMSSKLISKKAVNGEEVAKFYFTGLGNSTDGDQLRMTIGVGMGDFWITCPAMNFGKHLTKSYSNNRVYQYYYTKKLSAEKVACARWMGACHADDMFPLLGVPFHADHRNEFDDSERLISLHMMDIVSHFAKTGTPPAINGSEWLPWYRSAENDKIITPYYEITDKPRRKVFGTGVKVNECDNLWEKYIEVN